MTPRSRRLLAGLVPLALLAALAGCGGAGTPGGAAPTSFPAVRPEGVQFSVRPPAAAPAGPGAKCNALESLRPTGGLPPAGQMAPGSTMQKILANGSLKVGVDQNTYLFGYLNPLSGQIEGLDMDVAREVARAIFNDPGKVQPIAITTDKRIESIQKGTVDIVVDTMTMNCDRWQQVSFSTEYYEAGQRILVERNSPVKSVADLGGKRVCAAGGSTSIANIAANPGKTNPPPVPVSVRDWTDCLVMLQQGDIDAISTDDTILSGMQLQDPNDLQLVGTPFTSEPYGIAIAKDRSDLVRFVNAVLQRMRDDGTLHQLYVKWLKGNAPAKVPDAAYQPG